MDTPGLKVPTSLTAAPSSRVKVTREIGSAAISEKRTCKADGPTVEGASSLLRMVTGGDTSQLASSIGGAEANAIREPSIREVNTLLFLCRVWGGEELVHVGVYAAASMRGWDGPSKIRLGVEKDCGRGRGRFRNDVRDGLDLAS